VPIDRERVAAFCRILERFAPHWLEELDAFAGADREACLHFNCRKPTPSFPACQANCSTVLALGTRSHNGQPLLLKVRDEAPHPQIMFIRQVSATHPALSGVNVGNLGLAHFRNAAGLAGANNTGGPLVDDDSRVGLNDCHALRIVAERAGNCAEALELLRGLLAQRVIGHAGFAKGMIFLFADATGRGSVVECSRTRLAHRFYEDGIVARTNHFLFEEMESETDRSRFVEPSLRSSFARYERLQQLVGDHAALSPENLVSIASDAVGEFPICNTTPRFPWRTVSAWIHCLTRADAGGSFTLACNAAPPQGAFEPVRAL